MQRRNGNRPSVREVSGKIGNRILSHLRALLFLGIGLLIAGHAHATTLVCGLDSGGSGQINETASCTGDAGTLCPLDAVACTAAQSTPTCPAGGSYVSADDQCEAASWTCSLDGSQYDGEASCTAACSLTAACTAGVCPYGSYVCDADNNCTQTGSCVQGGCPSGYTVTGGICAVAVTCAMGTYSSTAKACVDNTSWVCPYGAAYPCLSNAGTYECSTATCIDPSTAQITTVSTAMLQNNGATDASGNCLGTIYIFSGRKMTCNESGVQSGWKNCCQAGSTTLGEDVGSAVSLYTGVNAISNIYHLGQIAYYGTEILGGTAVNVTDLSTSVQGALQAVAQGGSLMDGFTTYAEATFLDPTTLAFMAAAYLIQEFLLSGSCTQEDLETAMMDAAGRCHSLGTYCSDKWPLVGCVQRAEAFCCFNSMLARIIQEQGRPQLTVLQPEPLGRCYRRRARQRGLPGVHLDGVPDARLLENGFVLILRADHDAGSVRPFSRTCPIR